MSNTSVTNKSHIIEQFSQFVQHHSNSIINTDATVDRDIDLFSLFEVLTVLKNEVKTQSRRGT